MDDTPNYANYSLAELEDVSRHIDREKYADRYAIVVAEIEKRQKEPTAESVKHRTSISFVSVIVCGFKGAILGAVVGLLGSIAFIWFLSLFERDEYGHVNWDHAIGIGIIPILAVPMGVVLGLIIGSIRACKRD